MECYGNAIVALVCFSAFICVQGNNGRVLCYYNPENAILGKTVHPHLEYCTHLVVKLGTIDNNKLVIPENTTDYLRSVRKHFPKLWMVLSVGGGDDPTPNTEDNKYMALLKSPEAVEAFIKSAIRLKDFHYDGIDLAWQFPTIYPDNVGTFRSIFTNVKSFFKTEEDIKEKFSAFVCTLADRFKANSDRLSLSVTVNPNVNYTKYINATRVADCVDTINLMAYDFYTSNNNPTEAYHPAALYQFFDENVGRNVNATVTAWSQAGVQHDKLILGIPTFGRAWTMTDVYAENGIAPFQVKAYYKINDRIPFEFIVNRNSVPSMFPAITIIEDNKLGSYAMRIPYEGNDGFWVGFEDLRAAASKAQYARDHRLGGVAVQDISHHQFGRWILGDEILKTVFETFKDTTDFKTLNDTSL